MLDRRTFRPPQRSSDSLHRGVAKSLRSKEFWTGAQTEIPELWRRSNGKEEMAIVFGERASGDRVAIGNAGRYSRTERWSRSSRQEASHQQGLHRPDGRTAGVAYRGGITGYRATKPRKGQKIDPNAPPS